MSAVTQKKSAPTQARLPKVDLFAHHIGRIGGMESMALNLLLGLQKLGVHTAAQTLSNQPGPSLNVHNRPECWVPGAFARGRWFDRTFRKALKQSEFSIVSGTDTQFDADIRIVHFVQAQADSMIRKGLFPRPNVRTPIHGLYQKLCAEEALRRERFAFEHTRHLVAISERVKREILEFYPKIKCPITVIHHGVELSPNGYLEKWETDSPIELLFVGALERKGIHQVLKALQHLGRPKDWKLTVLGDGNIPAWKKKAEEYGIADSIDWVGKAPAQSYFEKSHVLVFPSVYEPFGMVVSEAASRNCLPLASIECGALELWENRPDWMRVSAVDSAEKWATALRTILGDRKRARELTVESRTAFSNRSWQDCAEEYLKLIERMISSSQ